MCDLFSGESSVSVYVGVNVSLSVKAMARRLGLVSVSGVWAKVRWFQLSV